MAKQIIVLTKVTGSGGDQDLTAAFWFAVTAGQQIPQPNFISAWRGASQAEQSALRAGTVVEQIYEAQYSAASTTNQIEAALVTAFNTANTAFQAKVNPNAFYGAFYDGSAWNAAGPIPPGSVSSLAFGEVTISTSGDNTVITGVSGQAIAIVQLQIAAASAVTVLVKDGASTTLGGYALTAGTPVILPATAFPWFVTSAGNNWVLNLSGNVNVIVSGWYRQA